MTKSILKKSVAIFSAVAVILSCCFVTTFAAEGDVAQIGNVGYKTLNEVKTELEDRFGKLSDDLIIYMHEELFEKLAKQLNITNIRQTKNWVEITLDKELTNKIDGETLFFETTNLSRMFRFSMKFERLTITLDTIKLDKHFIYYLLDLLEIIKKSIKQFDKK